MSEKITPHDSNLFNQVDQQLAAHESATVLVERSDGTISAGQVATMGEAGKTAVLLGDGNLGKWVGNERLTDKYQENLARELAGFALRGDIVNSPVDHAGPDVNIRLAQRGADTARAEIAKAQQEGRGDDSRYWQEQLGKYNREIDGLQANQSQSPVNYTDLLKGDS